MEGAVLIRANKKGLRPLLTAHLDTINTLSGIDDLVTLNDFEMNLIDDIYIDTRYPSNFGLLPSGFPSQEEAREVLEIADRIFNQTITLTGGFHENR